MLLNSRNDATESEGLAPLKDCRRATDLPKPLSSPKSEAKSSLPKLLTQTQSTYTHRRSTTIRGEQIQARWQSALPNSGSVSVWEHGFEA